MVLTSSRILSCEVWLILMRNTSAPASNSSPDHRAVGRCRAKRCEDLDAAQAPHGLLPGATPGGRPDPPGGVPPGEFGMPGRSPGPPGPTVPGIPGTRCARLFVGFGQLHGPGALFAGIDLEKAGAVETARQAILGALDGEFLVARTHEGLSRPFAAAVVVERVDVINRATSVPRSSVSQLREDTFHQPSVVQPSASL